MKFSEAYKIMKRDLKILKANKALLDSIEAFKTSIMALGTIEQIMWERDVAVSQLKELGYELGEKIRN